MKLNSLVLCTKNLGNIISPNQKSFNLDNLSGNSIQELVLEDLEIFIIYLLFHFFALLVTFLNSCKEINFFTGSSGLSAMFDF